MSETVPSPSPGRYELFVGSAEGFHVAVMRRVHESNGTQASLPNETSQASIRQGQRTTSQGGSLARKRYQTGSVFLRGKNPVWIGRYREDVIRPDGKVVRKRRSIVLGTKKEFPTKRLAERRFEQHLARVNAIGYRPGRVATLGDFIERWRTEVLSKQEPSSIRAVKSHLKCYIIPHLSQLRLDQLGVENQQSFVTHVAQAGAQDGAERHWDALFDVEYGEVLELHLRTDRHYQISPSQAGVKIRGTALHLEAIAADSGSRSQPVANAVLYPHLGRSARW